jgi:hypothetical protein
MPSFIQSEYRPLNIEDPLPASLIEFLEKLVMSDADRARHQETNIVLQYLLLGVAEALMDPMRDLQDLTAGLAIPRNVNNGSVLSEEYLRFFLHVLIGMMGGTRASD